MADETNSVLKRKVGAAGSRGALPAYVAPPGLEVMLAKAARDAAGLDARAGEIVNLPPTAGELLELLPENALLALLAGPGEAVGLCALSPPLIDGLIEMQTTGRLDPGPGLPRKPTRIDAALSSGFINTVLAGYGVTTPGAAGYHYSTYLDTPRPLGLLLDEDAYCGIRVTLDLGSGAKSGEQFLFLPETVAKCASKAPPAGHDTKWSEDLKAAVIGVPVSMTAVLHCLQMPLADAIALKAGDVLNIPRHALGAVRLMGRDTPVVALARLGRMRGHRALRLVAAPGDAALVKPFEPMSSKAEASDVKEAETGG